MMDLVNNIINPIEAQKELFDYELEETLTKTEMELKQYKAIGSEIREMKVMFNVNNFFKKFFLNEENIAYRKIYDILDINFSNKINKILEDHIEEPLNLDGKEKQQSRERNIQQINERLLKINHLQKKEIQNIIKQKLNIKIYPPSWKQI